MNIGCCGNMSGGGDAGAIETGCEPTASGGGAAPGMKTGCIGPMTGCMGIQGFPTGFITHIFGCCMAGLAIIVLRLMCHKFNVLKRLNENADYISKENDKLLLYFSFVAHSFRKMP